jgi:hypothetical protein
LIATGGQPDANWTVQEANGTIGAAQTVFPNNADWWGFWPANGPTSDWIARNASTEFQGTAPPYTFITTFDLTGYNLAAVSLSGIWDVDDTGSLALNGHVLDIETAPYMNGGPSTFYVPAGSSDFQPGLNTLTITINTSDNFFEGVRLDGTVTDLPVLTSMPISSPVPISLLTPVTAPMPTPTSSILPTATPTPSLTPIKLGMQSHSVLGLTPPSGTRLLRVVTHGKSVQVYAENTNHSSHLLGSFPSARINELAVFGAKTPVKFVGGRTFKIDYVSTARNQGKPAPAALDMALAEWTLDQPTRPFHGFPA